MAKAPKYLDLDSISPSTEVVIKLKGKEHPLVPASLDDFIANTRKLQDLGSITDPLQEIEVVRDMLLRAFPSMTNEELGSLRLDQLKALVDFAQKHNGADDVDEQAQEDAKQGNPPAGE